MARGSITKVTLANNEVRWKVRIDVVDPVTGRRSQPQRTYRTRKEAEAGLATWKTQIDRGTAVHDTPLTLRDYLVGWLDTRERTVRPRTIQCYRQVVTSHILPGLGAVRLQKLTTRQVDAFYATRLAEGGRADGEAGALSGRTVRLIHTVLKMALQDALEQHLLPYNVAAAATAPRGTPPPVAVWTADELRAFLDTIAADPHAALWHVGLHTALRLGELLGLRWEDVDLDAGMLRVRQALVLVKNKRTFGDPKSKQGTRAIPLDPPTVALLRAHRAAQEEQRALLGADWHDEGLVFTSSLGTALDGSNIRRRFRAAVTAAGVRPISPKGMRHSHATLLMMIGVPPKVVSERLGHSDIALTLRTYSHVLPHMQHDASRAFAALVEKPATPPQEGTETPQAGAS